MATCDADGDAKVSVRIRAGWRHEWRRPPPHVKVHQIVPGPFKKSLPLVDDTPFYFIETKHFRTRHPRRKRLSPEMIAERRCASIRTGIPDPWADYLTFRGTPPNITKVSAEDKDLWSARLDLTESAWKKHGIKLTQGIPNPWEFWPKFSGLDNGDCPCSEPKTLGDCPCEISVPPITDLRQVRQSEPVHEIPPKKTSKKLPPETRKKPRKSFSCWKQRKRVPPQNAVQPLLYEPQWEFESQPCKSCGFSEPQVQPLVAKRCGCKGTMSQPPTTKTCECSKQTPKQEQVKGCQCVEKEPKQQDTVRSKNKQPSTSHRNTCGCSEKQNPPPDVPKPLPEKSCSCSEKQKPPPPVIAKPSPEKFCVCSDKLKPPPPPPAPPLVDRKPSPEKSCKCSINPKPLPVATKPTPPPVVAVPPPENYCRCLEKPKLPPPVPVVAVPPPENYCRCSEKPKLSPPVPVVAKPVAEKHRGCSEKPNLRTVPTKITADAACDCSDLPKNIPKIHTASEVPSSANDCGCSQLMTPLLLVEVNAVKFRECSQQTDSPKPPPPPRPPPPKCCEWSAPMQMQQPVQPNPMANNYCDFSGANSYLTSAENSRSSAKTCGDNVRSNAKPRPQEGVRSSLLKARTCRDTGYLQTTESLDRQQEPAKSTDTRSTAIQCDSLECIQRETVVAKVGPTYLQDDAESESYRDGQQYPTCKTNLAENDMQRLEELWNDYEKRKETPFFYSVQGERNEVPEPNQIVFDEDNFDDGGESNAPKRRGRLGSILKSPSCDNPESEGPAKRVSISLPENEGIQFFSADEENDPRKKGCRMQHRTSSGNISDVSSYAMASVAGSVTSATYLSRLNAATGTSNKSESVDHDSDEEVQIASVNLDDIEPLTRQVSSTPSVESYFSRKQGSKESVSNHSVTSKRGESDFHESFGSPGVVRSQESVCPIAYSNSKFQPNDGWPSHESNASVLSGVQNRMERIEELQNTFAAEDGRNDGQWPEEGENRGILNVGASGPFGVSESPTEIDNGDGSDYFHNSWQSAPSDTRATKDTEEPDQDFEEEAASNFVPTSPSRRHRGSQRRILSAKSHSTHIVGVPDLEPRHRRRCYACQMQEEEQRLQVLAAEKEGKKRESSAKSPKSAASGNRDDRQRARTPNYWFEKKDKGMAYYADEEAVVIADPRSINAKVSVIPKKRGAKSTSPGKNQPGHSARDDERRNRVLLEQEVYRPKHMGKPREYDFLGSTIQGQYSGQRFPGMGRSGSLEGSCSDKVMLGKNETTSSTQNIYFGNVPSVSPQNSFYGKAMGLTSEGSHSENPVGPTSRSNYSENTPRAKVMQGFLENGRSPTTQNRYLENETERTSDYGQFQNAMGPSNGCDVCCKPSVLNLVPNRAYLSHNRPLVESSGRCQEVQFQRQAMSPNTSGRGRVCESGRSDTSGPREVQRKGHKKYESCYDDCNPTLCSGCESSGHLKTLRSDQLLSQQDAVRPSHSSRTREYEYLGISGQISQKSEGKGQTSTDSCTYCCKAADCFDPNQSEKTSRMDTDGLGNLGKRASSMKKQQASHGSRDLGCNTSSCASNDGQQQAKESRNKLLMQQEQVRPKHTSKTREYELPGTALDSVRSKRSDSPTVCSGPKECPGPAYDSNTFLVDPIRLIKPSTSGGRGQDCVGQKDSRACSEVPTTVTCGYPCDEAEDTTSAMGNRPKEQGKKKNARSMFVSQPKRL